MFKYEEITVDLVIRGTDEAHGIGAELRTHKEIVGIASLYYPVVEYPSQNRALMDFKARLISAAPAKRVVFRAPIRQYVTPDRFYRRLDILANQEGKELIIERKSVGKSSDAFILMKDAHRHKTQIIEIF